MKKLIVLIAMMALPSVAFASASLDLQEGGDNAVSVAPGGTFTLDVYLDANEGWLTMGGILDASANNTFQLAATGDWAPNAAVVPGVAPNTGSATFTPGSSFYFGDYDYYDGTLGFYPDIGFQKTTVGDYPSNGFWPKTVLSILVTVAGDAEPGEYTMSLESRDFFNSASGYIAGGGNDLAITITPEPATMLLLAGALPFLRRRTA